MKTQYSKCYFCDSIVYLRKQTASNYAASEKFFARHYAVLKNGKVWCKQCYYAQRSIKTTSVFSLNHFNLY
nr:hp [Calliteara abietis nucleopolyhedrovirus]